MRKINSHTAQSGFTMIEALIYVSLLLIIALTSSTFLISILKADTVARSEQVAVSNATFSLQAIVREVRHAQTIYTPTSVFGSDSGQLSLRTPKDSPADHVVAYTDLYLDNGVIYLRRDDGSGTIPLTSGDTDVSVLRFDRFTNGEAEGIQATVTVAPVGFAPSISAPRTLTMFVSARIVEPQ